MLTMPPAVRVYVATAPLDCRKSFDGISAQVASVLQADPLSGHLFVFFNKRGNQCRILFWDRTGYCVVARRLARGRFHLAQPVEKGATHVAVDAAELALILEGIDLRDARRRRQFRLPAENASDGRIRACHGRSGLLPTPQIQATADDDQRRQHAAERSACRG